MLMALSDAMWEKYGIGKAFTVTDPATKAIATRNPFLHKEAMPLPARTFHAREPRVIFTVCNVALTVLSGKVRRPPACPRMTRKRSGSRSRPRHDARPVGVLAVNRAQEKAVRTVTAADSGAEPSHTETFVTVLGLGLALFVGLSSDCSRRRIGAHRADLRVRDGFRAKQAIAMSLIVVGAASLVGAARHWRAGRVDLGVAVSFGLVAMAASFAGARVAKFVSGSTQLLLLALVMCCAAISMARSPRSNAPDPDAGGFDGPAGPPSALRLMPVAIGVAFSRTRGRRRRIPHRARAGPAGTRANQAGDRTSLL